MPTIIIKLENLVVFIISVYFINSIITGSEKEFFLDKWYFIIVLWLSFDLSMFGYLVNPKVGAAIYNLIHNYILAITLIVIGSFWNGLNITIIGFTLMSHISLDRFLKFGLKYSSGFKDTHIQKL